MSASDAQGENMIELAQVQDVVSRWWFHYDQAHFDELAALLTEDVRFTCRTDTGTTDFEDFVRADHSGRDAVMAWQRPHRMGSPDPLRHLGINVHVTDQRDREADFASYLLTTQVVDGFPGLVMTAIVTGTVRRTDDGMCLAALHVVLDTQSSVPLEQRIASAS
jgi:hypothetical protein